MIETGAPGWLSWLSVRLWLRSRSQDSGDPAPCQAPCWAGSLLPSLPASPLLVLGHACSLSQINKKKNFFFKWLRQSILRYVYFTQEKNLRDKTPILYSFSTT